MMAWSPGWLASRVTDLPLQLWWRISFLRLAWWLIDSAWLALSVHSIRGAAFSPSTASSSKPLKLFRTLNCKLRIYISRVLLVLFFCGRQCLQNLAVIMVWAWFSTNLQSGLQLQPIRKMAQAFNLSWWRLHSLIVRLTAWMGWRKLKIDSLLPDPFGLGFLLDCSMSSLFFFGTFTSTTAIV